MEGNFTEHLGVGIEHRDDRTVNMTQKGSIEKIIATPWMKECKPSKTPALTTAPGLDAESQPWDQNHWNHTSIVRMLLCMSNNRRPDIAFAVSQVAQCTACPKELHARAVKCVVPCLAGTTDKGVIAKHNRTFDLKVWADADFAGTFGQEPSGGAKAVKPRCGHVITFGGVPLVWMCDDKSAMKSSLMKKSHNLCQSKSICIGL